MTLRRYGRWSAMAALAAASAAPSPAAAQQAPDLESIAFVSGWCDRMMLAGEEESSCRGPLYNVVYKSGRISFAFPADGLMLSFSGTATHEAGEAIQLRLDRITFAGEDAPDAASEAAEGICEFTDFHAGAAYVRCAGRTASGDFIGIFRSDGKPPTSQRF